VKLYIVDYVQQVAQSPYLLASGFTVADAYLSTVLGWAAEVGRWPRLERYRAHIAARAGVVPALESEM